MTELTPPTILDVLRARKVVNSFLNPTPLLNPAALSQELGCDVWLKCENLQPIGAFKIRGGLNLMSALTAEERKHGVITASTGNHGQSIAYAASAFGIPATVCVPEKSNPFKVTEIARLGAEIAVFGKDFDEAREWADQTARNRGLRYIHSMNEPLLIAGVATAYLEIIEQVPDLDYIVVPIGGGSGACGACTVASALAPAVKLIGVQAQGAPALYQSWKEGRPLSLERCDTFADGLATRVAFDLPLTILKRHLHEFVLVSDDEIKHAITLLLDLTHQLAEGAGAATTAAVVKHRDRLRNKKVALMLSGGNITLDTLRAILAEDPR